MKKAVKVFALAVLMIIGGQTMAQTRGALFLGASFPIQNYGNFNEDFSDFALYSNDITDDYAGAGIGFNAGLKWYFGVGVKGLGVMLSVDGIYNGPNGEVKTAYRDMEGNYDGQLFDGSFTFNATPKFINVPAMLGLNYIYHVNPNFGIYVEAGAGGNMRFITKMESVTKASTILGEIKTTSTQNYDMAFGFAYQAGIGFEVSKNLVIGCSFYDLGRAQVKGEENITIRTTIGDNSTTNKESNYNTFGTVHPYIIMARIGFSF